VQRVARPADPPLCWSRCSRRAAEAKLANGEQIDIGDHSLLCSTLARLATRIGLERIPRDITPSLRSYLVEATPP
jgi:hypothetical protein